MNGRHYKSLFIITMQYPLGIPPNLRTNIDYVFILRENIVSNRRRIYEQFAGMFSSFDMFCQVMDQCTENYECLVVHNASKSNRIEDQVFWYKADSHPSFQLGHPDIWRFNSVHLDAEDDTDEDEFDPNLFKRKKNMAMLTVKKV
jgi:hypothetical protein